MAYMSPSFCAGHESGMVNTAVEAAVDFAAKGERHPLAGKAKDVAAGAVLISAIFAAIIGMLIFLPKIMALIFK